MNRKRIGDRAESQACTYLQDRGLQLIQRNFRCRGGEIDLVMRHDDSLVFVEVRYRNRSDYGLAAETVSRTKRQRVIHCAKVYMHSHNDWNVPARFDVISIAGDLEHAQIDWISDAFQLDA